MAALAVVSLMACSKTGNEGTSTEEGAVTLKKAALSTGEKMSWKKGECVKVFDSEGSVFDTRVGQDCEQFKASSKLKGKPLFILAGPENVGDAEVSGNRAYSCKHTSG